MPLGLQPGVVVSGTGLQLAPQGVWKKILRPVVPHYDDTTDLRALGAPIRQAPGGLEPQAIQAANRAARDVASAASGKPPAVVKASHRAEGDVSSVRDKSDQRHAAPRTDRRDHVRRSFKGSKERRPSSQDTSPKLPDQAKAEDCLAKRIVPGWFGGLASSSRNETEAEMRLLASVFADRPPVVFFDYDPRCNAIPRDCSRLLASSDVQALGIAALPQMFFCLQTTRDVHEYNAVVNTFTCAGFGRVSADSSKFAIYWGPHPTPEMLRGFNPFQKANHFPGSWQLGRKDFLGKNIYRMKRQFPKDYNILPGGFTLPEESAAWNQAREKNPNFLWIWKPINLSCGKGIRLFGSSIPPAVEKKISQRAGIVQRYIDRPLCINGFKFDLRLYVVVTSFDPLKVYINQEGLVRLATQQYRCSSESLDERTMHLTNYSVNKHAACYKQNLDKVKVPERGPSKAGKDDDMLEDCEGSDEVGISDGDETNDQEELPAPEVDVGESSKWSLRQLEEYLTSQGVDYMMLMSRIEDVIIKTLIAAEPQIVNTWHQGANFSTASPTPIQQVTPNQTCFEIYGFDVMVDEELQPWLLEVNVFPSFSSSSPYDKRVKTQLVADVFTLIGLMPYDHDVVDKACKGEQAKRLQGSARSLVIGRSHTVSSIKSASLNSFGEAEWRLIMETHDENMRRGHLTRIFPREGSGFYSQFFSTPRYSNLVLERWIQLGGEQRLVAQCAGNGLPLPVSFNAV